MIQARFVERCAHLWFMEPPAIFWALWKARGRSPLGNPFVGTERRPLALLNLRLRRCCVLCQPCSLRGSARPRSCETRPDGPPRVSPGDLTGVLLSFLAVPNPPTPRPYPPNHNPSQVVKRFVGPSTREKIQFMTSKEANEAMLAHFDPGVLPREYGGELEEVNFVGRGPAPWERADMARLRRF